MDLTVSPAEKTLLIQKHAHLPLTEFRNDALTLRALVIHGAKAFRFYEPCFLYALNACRQMPRVKQSPLADHIYEQFIVVKAPMEINISEAERKEIGVASTKEVKVQRGGRVYTESVTARTAATFDSVLLTVERLIRQNEKNPFLSWLNETKLRASSISQVAMNASVSRECQAEIKKLASLGAPIP